MAPATYIQSTPLLDGTFFERAVIYITEYNDKGATGFIVNRLFSRSLNELVEFSDSPSFPLYEGGPVDTEHLFFVHRRSDLIPGGTLVVEDVYVGGDFKCAVQHINGKTLTHKDIKIFIGYCGWHHGELEAEMEEGSWIITSDATLF